MRPQVARRPIGDRWENAALAYLRREGLGLVARNVQFRFGEIDLIMTHGEVLVFVEVRYRARSDFGGAAGSVNVAKCRRMVSAARLYLARNPDYQQWRCRFDVLTVLGNRKPEVNWIRDAFRLDDL